MGMSLVLGLLNSAVFADGEAEYDYRHGVMEAIGGHMTAMVTILRKGVHQDELALHASGIATPTTSKRGAPLCGRGLALPLPPWG